MTYCLKSKKVHLEDTSHPTSEMTLNLRAFGDVSQVLQHWIPCVWASLLTCPWWEAASRRVSTTGMLVRRSLDMGGRDRCQRGPARLDVEEGAGRHRRKGRGKRRNSYLRLEALASCAPVPVGPAPFTPVLRAPLPSRVTGRPPGGSRRPSARPNRLPSRVGPDNHAFGCIAENRGREVKSPRTREKRKPRWNLKTIEANRPPQMTRKGVCGRNIPGPTPETPT